MTQLALYDMDLIRYKAGFACEKKYYNLYLHDQHLGKFDGKRVYNKFLKDEGINKDHPDLNLVMGMDLQPLAHCLHTVKLMIQGGMEGSGAKNLLGFLSESPNNREVRYPSYKSSRKGNERPTYYQAIGEYLRENYSVETVRGDEADDRLVDYNRESPEDTIIITSDKDMNTAPGWRYNPDKKVKYRVSPYNAELWFWCQMIMGDSADSIIGIPGMGPKGAYKLLKDTMRKGWRGIVAKAYVDAYNGDMVVAKEEFQKSEYLLRIGNRSFLYGE